VPGSGRAAADGFSEKVVNHLPKYRHELKIGINSFDKALLSSRLSHVMRRDRFAGPDGSYVVRSLYFDDIDNHALMDKFMGAIYREKFRIRTYDREASVIRLELKVKNNGLGYKEAAPLSRAECAAILAGDSAFLKHRPEMVCRRLYSKMSTGLFKPRTIVQYEREAYEWDPGRVRVTLDSNLVTGLSSVDFLNSALPLTGVTDEGLSILEIKYDEFLPAHIADLLMLNSRQRAALSKYAICRRFD
jgi:hypothetical protein